MPDEKTRNLTSEEYERVADLDRDLWEEKPVTDTAPPQQ